MCEVIHEIRCNDGLESLEFGRGEERFGRINEISVPLQWFLERGNKLHE